MSEQVQTIRPSSVNYPVSPCNPWAPVETAFYGVTRSSVSSGNEISPWSKIRTVSIRRPPRLVECSRPRTMEPVPLEIRCRSSSCCPVGFASGGCRATPPVLMINPRIFPSQRKLPTPIEVRGFLDSRMFKNRPLQIMHQVHFPATIRRKYIISILRGNPVLYIPSSFWKC
jgi:hypothetical protein